MSMSSVEYPLHGAKEETVSVAMSSEPKPLTLAEVEREIIASAIQHIEVGAAAKALGISRATLYRKLRQYNLPRGTELPQFARLMQAAANAATFLERCSGTTAPALGQDLRESIAPFLGTNR